MKTSKEIDEDWNKKWVHEPLHKDLIIILSKIRDELHEKGLIDLNDSSYDTIPSQFKKIELPFTMIEVTIMYLISNYEKDKDNGLI